MRSIAGRSARAVPFVAFALLAFSVMPARAYQKIRDIEQAEASDASGRITVEAAVIHVIQCNGSKEDGKVYYIYQYTKRPGFRAILPPEWANSIGNRDFVSFDEAAIAACGAG
jgi:hypothetical protein